MLHPLQGFPRPGCRALYGGDIASHVRQPLVGAAACPGRQTARTGRELETRFSKLPDVPTIAESGLPGYETSAWFGLVAPAGTPAAIVEQLNRDVAAVLADNDVRSKLLEMGMTPQGGSVAPFQAVIDAGHPEVEARRPEPQSGPQLEQPVVECASIVSAYKFPVRTQSYDAQDCNRNYCPERRLWPGPDGRA